MKLREFYKKYDHLISGVFSTYNEELQYQKERCRLGRCHGYRSFPHVFRAGPFGGLSYSWLMHHRGWSLIQSDLSRGTDQRHTFASMISIGLGSAWDLSVRMVYGSGYPYTPSVAEYNKTMNQWNWSVGRPNSATIPGYKRSRCSCLKRVFLFGCARIGFFGCQQHLQFHHVQTILYVHNRGPAHN